MSEVKNTDCFIHLFRCFSRWKSSFPGQRPQARLSWPFSRRFRREMPALSESALQPGRPHSFSCRTENAAKFVCTVLPGDSITWLTMQWCTGLHAIKNCYCRKKNKLNISLRISYRNCPFVGETLPRQIVAKASVEIPATGTGSVLFYIRIFFKMRS